MEETQELYNGFDFKGFSSMEETINETKLYVKNSREGKRIIFPTKWERLNTQLMGGLQPGKLYTIAARPGAGKSQFSNQLLFDVLDLAKSNNRKMAVFYWTFEMPGYQQLLRIASGDLKLSVYDIIKESKNDKDFIAVSEVLDKFKQYPIFFYEVPETIIFMKNKITQFCSANPDVTLICVLDHSRLVKGDNKEEMQRLADITKMMMEQQAKYKIIDILISQLNRNIESPERANNQYQPQLSDVFGSDAIAQDSHVVMMLNRPHDIYGIEEYYCGENPRGLLAVHIEKNREGELGMIPFQTHYPSFHLTERKKV